MASVNKVILIGNLGKDPETRYTADGAAITNASVATTHKWKGSDGQKKEETEWHRIVFFGKLAEIAGEYLRKGKPVYIEGRLKTRKWADKDGLEKYSTEIVAESMQFLGSKDEGGGEREERPARKASSVSSEPKPSRHVKDDDDDIPF